MSLNFDLTAISEDVRLVPDPEGGERRVMSPITNGLIWSTIGVGMGTITEDNWEEFYARLSFLEKLNGSMLQDADGPVYLTAQNVRDHVGLKTNVFPKDTEAKFLKRQFAIHKDYTVRGALQEVSA